MTRRKEHKPGESTHSPAPDPEPPETRDREELIDEILEETFPASDPPAWSSLHVYDEPPRPRSRPERPQNKARP